MSWIIGYKTKSLKTEKSTLVCVFLLVAWGSKADKNFRFLHAKSYALANLFFPFLPTGYTPFIHFTF